MEGVGSLATRISLEGILKKRIFTNIRYENVGHYLAKRGFPTALISYRLFPEVSYTDQLRDIASSIRWIQLNATQYGKFKIVLEITDHL
jgi:hypothetical protein